MKKIIISIILTLLLSVAVGSLSAAEKIRYHGSSTVVSVISKSSVPFRKEHDVILDIKSKSSGTGIEMLLAGKCDIAGVGRPITQKLIDQGIVATKLFVDAYAVIVNNEVAVDRLTPSQLGGLLTGKTVSWAEFVSGKSHKVKLVTPPPLSAHFKNFQEIFGIGVLPKGSAIAAMTPYVIDKVKQHPRSIGWLSYSTVYRHLGEVKIVAIENNGKSTILDKDTVLSGEYPYTSEQYLYTKGEPTGNVKELIAYLQSEAGQEIIRSSGFFLPGT
ncbi:MAG: substrate-binding domain-containing protein [Desulfobulbaceae bacterium]|nr:substrate-binding domain-containing protein [Desulfobulbaceae bacterium]